MAGDDPKTHNFPRKFGKYHLLSPLAQGGMGALYLAATGDRGLERLLVIKTVLPHLADSEYVARFRDEAKVVVQLSHQNLIPVFDAGQVDGELFLAMEYVEGKDLRAVWNRCAQKGVAFPLDVAAFVVKELCRGLSHAHSAGDLQLVHRDVSPPNVLLSYAGEVKLTDFGLAASTLKVEKTAPGIVYGKVSYMSPEQARGETLDGRSDLYAAAIILWELLTGRQLFPPGEDQPSDLAKRAKNPDPQPPSKRATRVPKELDAICMKALAPDPKDRYQNGEEFRKALATWLAAAYPATDAKRCESFLYKLFADDIVVERDQRDVLLLKTRERVKTLPPSHELRVLFEKFSDGGDRRQDEGPNLGRRDKDAGGDDDRRKGGRRAADALAEAVRGVTPATSARPKSNTELGHAVAVAVENEPSEAGDTDVLGEVLDERYRVVELIGEGGMGKVYLAEHVEIGKRFALKVLHPVYGHMPELVERFRREARAASKIGHPNIVDVTDSGTTGSGSVYFVMEYLEGVELASVIDGDGALEVGRALRIATQICRALAAAHSVEIIHRDLKPENVFLTVREGSSDFVKVLDFGIAKSAEGEQAREKRLTHPGMAMGTPEYMAPEQAAGRPADARTDIYATGAILYEMLTGQPPYSGDNFMEILSKKATEEPVRADELRPELAVPVADLVMQAMARSPEDRPPSMEAFEYELTKCLSGRGAAVAGILGIPRDVNSGDTSNPPRWDGPSDPGRSGATPPVASVAPVGKQRTRADSGDVTERRLPAVDVAAEERHSAAIRAATYTGDQTATTSGLAALGWAALLAFFALAGGALILYGVREKPQAAPLPPVASAAVVQTPAPVPPVPDKANAAVVPTADAGPAVAADGGTAALAPAGEPGKGGGEQVVPPDKPDSADDKDKVKDKDKDKDDDKGAPRSAKDAQRLIDAGYKALYAGKHSSARAKFEQVRGGKYKVSSAQLGLAEVAFDKGQFRRAVKHGKRAGSSQRAQLLIANSYYRLGNCKGALSYYKRIPKKSKHYKATIKPTRTCNKRLGQ